MGQRARELVAKGIEKVSAFFPLDFSVSGLQQSKGPETRGKAQSKRGILSVQEDWVREHLNQLDTFEPMGAGRVHSQADKFWDCSW